VNSETPGGVIPCDPTRVRLPLRSRENHIVVFVLRFRVNRMLVFASFIAASAITSPVLAAGRVPLVVNESAGKRTVAFPVTTGIPFPRGGLTAETHCRLVDDMGRERPLQTKVAATWDAAATSIRWLTIDFLAEPGRKYALEFGPEVKRGTVPSQVRVAKGEILHILTGAMTVDFTRTGPAGLGAIRVDLDGDGEIEPEEIVARGGKTGDHVYIDQDGHPFSSAQDGNERKIVVETAGPLRACVRVDGFYTGPKGERVVAYRSRYHLFAGLPIVKVIDQFRIIASTKETRFRDVAFALDLDVAKEKRKVRVDASGEPGNQMATANWQADTASVSSYQTTYRHYGNPEHEAAFVSVGTQGETRLQQSDRMGEWMQLTDPRASVTASLRWFWQQFPKEWETTEDQLLLHLWSPRAGELDFGPDGLRKFFGKAGKKYLLEWDGVREPTSPVSFNFYFCGRDALERGDADGQGIDKHHEFWLHFGSAAEADRGAEYARLAASPPLALATGEWNCSTDVFGPLAARPNDSKYEAIVDRNFDLGREAQDAFGDYGWWLFGSGPHYSYQWDAVRKRHYADPRRFEYHTYQKETQLWWCYLRSGERKFFDWALPSENHWADIAVSHVPLRYRCSWRGGDKLAKDRMLHWRPGEWAIDSPLHTIRQRNSAEAWLRGGSQFWGSYHRTLETTTLAYYLTGDERFADVLKFWETYWGDLAGKTNASTDLPIWYREQPWYQPAKPGEKPKTWAEMIRDYAPFSSGSRHQLTLFFNLATMYEQTWNPRVGRALREYADAFLDEKHRMGVWRSQQNDLPTYADVPEMAHFWSPALWKYARATGDPRMKQILPKYFQACYAADPFRENVGNYSNAHIAWAYYFTRDPKHLHAADIELERLWPNALPLNDPRELGTRIYNPHNTIRVLTGTPRLIWSVKTARRNGVKATPPLLMPQRTEIAFHKQAGKAIKTFLWSFDAKIRLIGPNGRVDTDAKFSTKRHATALQPFDRTLPEFAVYLHELTIPATAAAGPYVVSPQLETAVLSLTGCAPPVVSASRATAVQPGQTWFIPLIKGASAVVYESAKPSSLQFADATGEALKRVARQNRGTVELTDAAKQRRSIRLKNIDSQTVWFRLVDRPANAMWVAKTEQALGASPNERITQAAISPTKAVDMSRDFVPGRFGQALRLTAGSKLTIPDHVEVDGKTVRLFNLKQGTIEFRVRRWWDERIAPTARVTFLTNGLLQAWNPWKLPVGKWSHLAVVWRPAKRDPTKTIVHIYVDGHDYNNYRSTWWDGYGRKPFFLSDKGKWLEAFIAAAPPGAMFDIDDLRISSVPRYADLDVTFGPQQTVNPTTFTPPNKPLPADENTLLLFRFDGNLTGDAVRDGQKLQATLESSK
jgi:hypothetical protein